MQIFRREVSDYKTDIMPMSHYIKQAAIYITKMNGGTYEENVVKVKKILISKGINNPTVKYKHRDELGNESEKESKLTEYMKESIDDNQIIVPSFTTYVHPTIKKSIHAEFLDNNIRRRNENKHKAFEYQQQGNMEKYVYHDTIQKTMKIFNNSLSGAYGSSSTVLYNPSAHYTLTSITRSVTSIGNAVTESIVAGNRHYKNADTVFNYITTILENMDREKIEATINKFNIYIPNSLDVFNSIYKSSSRYWNDTAAEKNILNYLDKLDGIELAAILYINDLYHLRMHNDNLIRNFLGNMGRRVTTGSTNNLKDIKSAPAGIMNLVHHICLEDIKGMSVNYSELEGTDTLTILASTAKNIVEVLNQYVDILHAFFVTNIMPPTIAYIKDLLRDVIVLSDTDSTCGAYDEWVEWYYGKVTFTPEAIGLSASVMTINTQIIDHYLKMFAINMNVDVDSIELIKMKNEFFWDTFTSTNVSKHYFANIRIQEGNVFEKPKLELKGVNLIASTIASTIRTSAHDMIKSINKDIVSGDGVDMYKYIKLVADAERELIENIKLGKTDIFKLNKVKDKGAYKQSNVMLSPYYHHMLWEEVFKDKYGTPGDPTYMVIVITTELSSKAKINEFLENMKDTEIRDRLKNFLIKSGKDKIGTFRVPLAIAKEKGIPEEILPVIDLYKVVSTTCNVMYMVLESIGFYRKPDLLVSQMGY